MFVFMESDRLWYRTMEAADAPTIGRWINDWTVRQHLATPNFPIGMQAELDYIRAGSSHPPHELRTDVRLLFGRKGDSLDKPIGASGFVGINWLVAGAEWGIQIGEPKHWGKGYGREVCARFLRYAFVGLNLNRMHLRVNAGNAGGIKAYTAAGYKFEAKLPKAGMSRDGLSDLIFMHVLRDEWRATQERS